ncbi:OLC1v1030047C1 [Oldenlandia corymbosa var. corymbosa]|uniref:OLC1v1030047C1 n=1 Tax=Oldenlandia corymbosa var. corymbosa TaxID=529605 RepID=A0AAV1CFW8_OLDCO|nr:OLC1v1030047C1 [Oldenlandia corymbosa var. corymbosa]
MVKKAARDWSGLPHEMLVEIVTRIPAAEDFTAFRGVCTSWRAAASKDNYGKSFSRIPPLLMLAENAGDEREFYNLSSRKITMGLSVPGAKGKLLIEARFGWLFTVVVSSGEVNLLNPFSGAQIPLPNFKTCPEFRDIDWNSRLLFMNRAILSANPWYTSDFTLMIIFGSTRYLGFWRPNNLSWTRTKSSPLYCALAGAGLKSP